MITNKLKLDLKHCGITPTIDAAQEDILSRGLELSLYDGKKAYLLPENLAVRIHYKKADGKGGEYDTLPDGRPAWSAHKNRLTILLTHQMFTFPGFVDMTVSLVSAGKQISTFPIQINVLPEARPLSENSEDYFNITGFLVAPGNAESGQFLKIKSVNSEGRVTEVEPGLPDQAPADWNAAEGEPGHILNRPFYEADGELKTIDKKFLPDDVGGVNVSGATPGQMIIVKAVDETGKPTQWEAVDPVTGANWDAAEDEPGHILNRPFYSTLAEGWLLPARQPVYDPDEGCFFLFESFTAAVGTECTVNWNSAAYHCVVQDLSFMGIPGIIGIGDLNTAWPDMGLPGNGEPFVIISGPAEAMATMGAGVVIIPIDGSTETELTLSIRAIMETVTPIPEKYLANARGQKKYTIDLDNGIAGVSVETLMEMDAAEIQGALTVIYQGQPHSVSVVEMTTEMVGGTPYSWIIFAMNHSLGQTVTFQYHNLGGLTMQRTGSNVSYNFSASDHCLYVKRPNETSPRWDCFDSYAFPGILLRSTTTGSTKTFWITVDDSGALTATQK